MINIIDYLNDGANWQAQAVLAYLKGQKGYILEDSWNEDLGAYMAKLFVGRYENCREQGYIFSIVYRGKQRNYAVYEHRNSDNLCVVVFDRLTLNTPTLDDVGDFMKDKYDCTETYPGGEIERCGDYIAKDMKNFISSVKEEK